MRYFAGILMLITTLAAASSTGASAQMAADPEPAGSDYRTVEYFLVRQQLDSRGGDPRILDGVGGRILWPLASLTGIEHESLLNRTSVGAFLVHVPGSSPAIPTEIWHFGAQLDLRLTEAPVAELVDPLISLGIGAMHMEERGTRKVLGSGIRFARPPERSVLGGLAMPVVEPEMPTVEVTTPAQTRTSLTIAPGIGARVPLLPGIDLHSNLSLLFDVGGDLSRATELRGGISLSV